jgi:hypothetical protein
MLQALCKRRNIRIKHERYANALTASAVYNTARHSADDPTVTAFDFIRDEASAQRKEKRRQANAYIKKAIGDLPMGTSRKKYLEVRGKAIADVKAFGYADAEALMNECWPSLQPTEDEVAL